MARSFLATAVRYSTGEVVCANRLVLAEDSDDALAFLRQDLGLCSLDHVRVVGGFGEHGVLAVGDLRTGQEAEVRRCRSRLESEVSSFHVAKTNREAALERHSANEEEQARLAAKTAEDLDRRWRDVLLWEGLHETSLRVLFGLAPWPT